jgi:multidrug efflux pump subunit AcrA (membrane-fusion protein)
MIDARNKLALRTIAAPTGGVVVIGAHHIAPGVVITANDPVLDIVPADDPLVVEARVQTKDVKDLVPGLTTRLVLSAYDSRVLGTLGGTVEYVSADRMTDPANPQQPPYYLAKIKLDRATPKQIDVGNGHLLPIRAGMPVEVRIQVAGRTPIDYIVGPITQSYLKAFIQ